MKKSGSINKPSLAPFTKLLIAKYVIGLGTVFTTLHFLHNLCMHGIG
jgi:hypothetical protein